MISVSSSENYETKKDEIFSIDLHLLENVVVMKVEKKLTKSYLKTTEVLLDAVGHDST